LLLLITPNRDREPSVKTRQLAATHPFAARHPSSRSRENSRLCLIRLERPSRSRRADLAAIARQDSDRRQALAAHTPAIVQNASAAFARVPAQEPVLAFAPDF